MSRLKKLVVVQGVLAIGLASIFALPEKGIRESAIVMSLPTFVGKWHGRSLGIDPKVLDSLAKDTDYEQKHYRRFSPKTLGDFEFLTAFIVLSGHDMNNSIHRPERCIVAQGQVLEARSSVEIGLGKNRKMEAMRLKSSAVLSNGVRRSRLTYYWFTGAEQLTNSHYMRTFIDMKDRIFTGTNQRWAYVTVAADYDIRGIEGAAHLTEEETDALLQEFIAEVFDDIHKEEQLARTGG